MTTKEFNKKCDELHRQYKKVFGKIPNRVDFICTQENYLTALQTAIRTKIEVERLLPRRYSGPKMF